MKRIRLETNRICKIISLYEFIWLTMSLNKFFRNNVLATCLFYDFGKVEFGLVKSFYGLSNGSW